MANLIYQSFKACKKDFNMLKKMFDQADDTDRKLTFS